MIRRGLYAREQARRRKIAESQGGLESTASGQVVPLLIEERTLISIHPSEILR